METGTLIGIIGLIGTAIGIVLTIYYGKKKDQKPVDYIKDRHDTDDFGEYKKSRREKWKTIFENGNINKKLTIISLIVTIISIITTIIGIIITLTSLGNNSPALKYIVWISAGLIIVVGIIVRIILSKSNKNENNHVGGEASPAKNSWNGTNKQEYKYDYKGRNDEDSTGNNNEKNKTLEIKGIHFYDLVCRVGTLELDISVEKLDKRSLKEQINRIEDTITEMYRNVYPNEYKDDKIVFDDNHQVIKYKQTLRNNIAEVGGMSKSVGVLLLLLTLSNYVIANPVGSSWPFALKLSNVLIGGIICLIGIIILKKRTINKKHRGDLYIKDRLDNEDFVEYWKGRINNEPFIEIDYQRTSPTLEKEGSNTHRYPLKEAFVKDFFLPMHRGSKYALILGDSGSGKTTALVNLLIDYVNRYKVKSLPYDIQIYSLGNEDVWDKITKDFEGKDRRKCILLLDALDENEDAQVYSALNGTEDYMVQLAEMTKDFARVVVTCRSQFFKDEKSVPGIIRKVGQNIQEWDKYYLSLFNDKQIGSYLTQKFGVPSTDPRCEKARRIVNSSPDFCRPLILSWIDDIVNRIPDGEINSLKDVYGYIIASWINRDAKDEADFDALMEFSSNLALFMYRNGISSVGEEQYQQFLKEYGIEDKADLYRGRSLLNRGTYGYKFSHRSFYEYFLANIFFNDYGEIKSVQGLDFAVRIFDELYEEYQQTENHTEKEDARVAAALYNLGYYLDDLNHYKEAEKKYSEALKKYRQLAKDNSDAYLPYLAMTLNNLANRHRNTNNYEEAEKEYKEALKIRRQLAKKYPDEYQPDVAMTLNNLAILHRNTNNYEEAEKEYQEALEIYRQLAEKNPDEYQPYVATTLNNLGVLHDYTHHYEEAEKEYQEALYIYGQLAEKNPDAYLPDVAMTLNNLGILHSNTDHPEDAEKEYQEALKIRRQLAEKNPDAFLPDVAQTLYNIALLHLKLGHLKEALGAAQESLEKYLIMAEISHEAFDKDVQDASELVEDIRSQMDKGKKN